MVPSALFDADNVNEPPKHTAPPPLTITADGEAFTIIVPVAFTDPQPPVSGIL
jgi:hypothetical protein